MIYQLKITLSYTKPPIWRRVLVPESCTLAQLHDIIQITMGWFNCHLHSFEIRGQNYSPKTEFDDDYNDDFFKTVRFNTADFSLKQVLKKGGRMIYFYDFGDGWEHVVFVEDVLEKSEMKLPLCIKVVGACPPEDSGGIPGYR